MLKYFNMYHVFKLARKKGFSKKKSEDIAVNINELVNKYSGK